MDQHVARGERLLYQIREFIEKFTDVFVLCVKKRKNNVVYFAVVFDVVETRGCSDDYMIEEVPVVMR